MNTKAKGERTEGIILGTLMRRGYVVLIPFGNNQRYDMVIDDNGKLIKCQCKTARYYSGCAAFNACSVNGFTGEKRSYRGQIDVFLVYFEKTDKVYMVPVEAVPERIAYLRVDPVVGRNTKKVKWASDFEI